MSVASVAEVSVVAREEAAGMVFERSSSFVIARVAVAMSPRFVAVAARAVWEMSVTCWLMGAL